jgi:4-carboxymuconolactone decarboxylase
VALIAYPLDDELPDDLVRAMDAMPVRLNIVSMLAVAPALLAPMLDLGRAILSDCVLDPALRELAILAVAQRTDTRYEWSQHESIAPLAGVSAEQIGALRVGAVDGDEFTEREAVVLRFVAALVGDGTPDEKLVIQTAATLGRAAFVELVLVVGYYSMLGGLMRTVRLDDDPPIGAHPFR